MLKYSPFITLALSLMYIACPWPHLIITKSHMTLVCFGSALFLPPCSWQPAVTVGLVSTTTECPLLFFFFFLWGVFAWYLTRHPHPHPPSHMNEMRGALGGLSADTSRNNDVVITSNRRRFDIITSKWFRFDVITTLSLRHVFRGLYGVTKMESLLRWRHDLPGFRGYIPPEEPEVHSPVHGGRYQINGIEISYTAQVPRGSRQKTCNNAKTPSIRGGIGLPMESIRTLLTYVQEKITEVQLNRN